jgi:hypothetical protein
MNTAGPMILQPLDALLFGSLAQGAQAALLVAAAFSLGLLIKSILDFTRTGPELAEEVVAHYRLYFAYSLTRLLVFVFLITAFMAFVGVVAYAVGLLLLGASYQPVAAAGAAIASVVLLTGRQFAQTLLISPGVIAASSLYSMTHFYPLWNRLTRRRLQAMDITLLTVAALWLAAGLSLLTRDGGWLGALFLVGITAFTRR